MPQRWVDRTFALGLETTAATDLVVRLRHTADRLEDALLNLPPAVRVHRPDGRWSIQEHAGHLLDLEGLWEQRLEDFDAGAPVLRPADIQNRQTWEAGYNDRPAQGVVTAFREARSRIVRKIEKMTDAELARTAVHPRLQQPMSVVDLCYFVAEHDDHHLGTIAQLAASLSAAPVYSLELVNTIERTVPLLLALPELQTADRSAPGKWSPREIIGHLIDSASNNHQRFVRAQFDDSLVFPGYQQDEWVAAQSYNDARWEDLVTLWASFNRHLARVMRLVPERVRSKPHQRHNLDRIAFRPVRADAPATLDYFMADYVDHLHHHLKQIGI